MNPSYRIAVEDRQAVQAVDAQWLVECLNRVLADEGVTEADLQVALVDDAEMQRINREFLDHDWSTDVISFSYAEPQSSTGLASGWPRGRGAVLDGELIVSVETAVRQAARHGWSLRAELLLYAVHGGLHLCGYDDLSDAERPWMRRREREVLAMFYLQPHGLEDEPTG
jgi:probable rRNA maturation factor